MISGSFLLTQTRGCNGFRQISNLILWSDQTILEKRRNSSSHHIHDLKEYDWQVLMYPHYSPDIAPSGFH